MQDIIGCCKDFDFYSEKDGKPLESLVSCCDMSSFALFIYLKHFLMFIYFEREREREQGRGRETRRERIPSRLCAVCTQPDVVLNLTMRS